MKCILSYMVNESPAILGPGGGAGRGVYVLMSDGSFKHFQFFGYLPRKFAKFIPNSRQVKIKALGLCDGPNIHTCKSMLEGWFLLGLYVEGGAWPGVFVLADAFDNPVEIFCPSGLPPAPSSKRKPKG